jgi:uncharacterized protein (DUF58 family)
MKLSVHREFSPSPVSAQSTTSVTIDAKNLAPIRSAPLYWNDTLPWRPLATDAARLEPLGTTSSHPSMRTSRLRYQLTPPRRGVFKIGPLAVAYSDPFGIAVGFMTIGSTSELVVTPYVADLPLSGLWLEAPDGAARLVQATGVGNADDLMTREYRRGDALRRVHWRASARHGELMVRQEEQRSYPEATIVFDTRAASYRGYWESDQELGSHSVHSATFEWSVVMLASLGIHLHRAGFVVHIAETAERQVIELADDEARLARESDFLLSLASVRLIEAHGRPETTALAQGPVFAIVSEPDDATLEWLAATKRPFELGAVFVVGGSHRVTQAMGEQGWHVIPVDPRSSPVLAWGVLAEELGIQRVVG